jgi:predicted PP-loop superfamily ATPase
VREGSEDRGVAGTPRPAEAAGRGHCHLMVSSEIERSISELDINNMKVDGDLIALRSVAVCVVAVF